MVTFVVSRDRNTPNEPGNNIVIDDDDEEFSDYDDHSFDIITYTDDDSFDIITDTDDDFDQALCSIINICYMFSHMCCYICCNIILRIFISKME